MSAKLPNAVRNLRVLFIEDLIHDAELITLALERGGYDVTSIRAESSESMRQALETGSWDVVLSDFNIPGFGAREALEVLKASGKALPFIVVSGAVGEETAVELMKAGADDFVMKSKLDRLAPAIERSLRSHHASLLAEQSQSAREHLLAVVSHDLKNPLGGISLNLQIALKKLEDAGSDTVKVSALKPSLERAQRSAVRMLSLIQGILDQTHIQTGHLTLRKDRASASMLMRELTELFQPLAEKSGLTFETHEDSEECIFEFDFERLFQALGNLVGNAIKFTPAGGKITVWYETTPTSVNFFVRDNGQGIPSDLQPFIFKRFWQAKHSSGQGLGLGLSICRGIIANHGGRIEILSEEGKGSTFQVTLPRETPTASKVPASVGKILIVDDDISLAESLADNLRHRGFQVEMAEDAEKGLEMIAQRRGEIALAVVDYRLPGMNGGDLIKNVAALRVSGPPLPIILCSAEPNLEELARGLPVAAIVSKPAEIGEFMGVIEKALRGRTSPGIPVKSLNNYLIRRVEDLDACLHALDTSDYEKIRSIAHRIKGSASTFGFPELSDVSRRIESALTSADPAQIKRTVGEFQAWISEHRPAGSP